MHNDEYQRVPLVQPSSWVCASPRQHSDKEGCTGHGVLSEDNNIVAVPPLRRHSSCGEVVTQAARH